MTKESSNIFSAEVSLQSVGGTYTGQSAIHYKDEATISPQACRKREGHCTGFGGLSCVTLSGEEACCDAAFQYPWIKDCNGDMSSGCGICLA